ncbi:LytTR family DNA-binding domain-containing protein [Algoriphagus sp. AGSA1]|uniref:LytR/AlgR family response regulator transcription factor n=1 Tax=unclassified Algoriphagus TaxID=2641541 RepID=UPI0017809ABC|nr:MULTISPECIES: LytTR family DNA-binding domain-containing protein [unclassified Algoriphagus]MCE7057590.1 LytTR family DNA-binding domain-containing protein [Algoriphagus sp. AGSA1]
MEKRYKVGLIDDEEHILDILIQEISMLPDFEVGFSTVDPVMGLGYLQEGKADILITDILMPELGGLEISRKLIDSGIPVIICSGHSRYASQGYKVEALDFLVKPPETIELTEALEKAKKKMDTLYWVRKELEGNIRVISDKLGYRHQVFNPSQILYMEQQNKISIVKLDDGSEFTMHYSFMESMGKLRSRYMVRVHQSFAVNILKIRKLHPEECELVSGDMITMSRTYKDEVRRIFDNRRIN